jgi:hypothetical protein
LALAFFSAKKVESDNETVTGLEIPFLNSVQALTAKRKIAANKQLL